MNEIKPFPNFVDKENIEILIDENNDLRYYIRIPLKYSKKINTKKILVIMKNPSKAKICHIEKLYESDNTVNRVLLYFYNKNYTEIVIVNLFAKYFTESNNLNDFTDDSIKIIGKDNDEHIQTFIESNEFERIVVAWGGYPENSNKEMRDLYKERIETIERYLIGKTSYFVERMDVKNKFPKHGLIWTIGAEMHEYKNRFNR